MANNSEIDSWDDGAASPQGAYTRAPPKKTTVIPDSWDDGSTSEEEDNEKIWSDANSKTPMPEVVRSSSTSTSIISPPATAFQPAMRILKRPSSNASPVPSASSAPRPPETLAEKEARYQAARERIFGENGQEEGASADAKTAIASKVHPGIECDVEPFSLASASASASARQPPSSSTGISRSPLGPAESCDDRPARGFGRDRSKEQRPA